MSWRTLALLGAYGLGVVAAASREPAVPNILLGSAVAGLAALIVATVLASLPVVRARVARLRPMTSARGTLTYLSLLLCCMLAGRLNGQRALHEAIDPPLRPLGASLIDKASWPVEIEGVLRSDAELTEYGVTLGLSVDTLCARGRCIATRGGVRVSVGGALGAERSDAWRAGRRVRLPVTLRAPLPYRNPGVPDQVRAFALRGTTWLGSAKTGALVDVLRRGNWLQELAAASRAHARRAVMACMAPRTPAGGGPLVDGPGARAPVSAAALHAGIVIAVLIGDRAGIPPEITDRLQRAGTFHVIAISGGNIAILAALALGSMRLCRAPPRLGAAAAAIGMMAYGFVASGSASVMRATVVAVIYLSARVADIRAHGFAVLWAAMLLLVAWSPLALFDAGFLLTCGATIGILLSGQFVAAQSVMARERADAGRPHPTGRRRRQGASAGRLLNALIDGVRVVTIATLAAEAVLLPIATRLFSRVTIAGLLLNPLAIPLMSVGQVAGLVITLTGGWAPPLASVAGFCASVAIRGLLWSATLVEAFPWLAWRVPPPTSAAIAAYYTSLLLAVVLFRTGRRRLAGLAVAATTGCAVWIAFAPVSLPSRVEPQPPAPDSATSGATRHAGAGSRSDRRGLLSVVLFDVGQGDAAMLAMPDGRVWLVDAGGLPGPSSFDMGARVVAPGLWALAVRRVETIVLTHGHPDHVGGAPSIITDFAPRHVWEGIPVASVVELQRAAIAATRVGAARSEHYRGERVRLGDVELRVLHPPRADWERLRVRNEDSVTLDLRFGGTRVLLPGDIGGDAERMLLHDLRVGQDERWLTFLKVPHHGSASASSPAFLEALSPAVAVVSAGRGNRFGHPAPATLSRYAALGIPMLRTDIDGAVAFVTDGRAAVVSSWNGRGWDVRWKGHAR